MKKLLLSAFVVVLLAMSYLAISYRHIEWRTLPDRVKEEIAAFKVEKTIPGKRQNVVDIPVSWDALAIKPKKASYRPPIARFMGQDIYAEQFFLLGHTVTDAEYESVLVFSKLRALLGKLAVDDFEKAHQIVVMEGDIDDYLAYKKHQEIKEDTVEATNASKQRLSDIINQRLDGIKFLQEKLSTSEDDALNQDLHAAINSQKKALMGDQLVYMYQFSDSIQAHSREKQRLVAANNIQSWKRHAALFDVFNGQVVCNNFNCQAIEAYANLVDDYLKTGAIEVLIPNPKEAIPHSHDHDHHVDATTNDAVAKTPARRINAISDARAKFYFEKPIWLRDDAALKEMQFYELKR